MFQSIVSPQGSHPASHFFLPIEYPPFPFGHPGPSHDVHSGTVLCLCRKRSVKSFKDPCIVELYLDFIPSAFKLLVDVSSGY